MVKAKSSQTFLICLELAYLTILLSSLSSSGHNPLLEHQVPDSVSHVWAPGPVKPYSLCPFWLSHAVG